MGFLSWLGNQASGVFHELDPWDNGANYHSVTSAYEKKKKKPRQTVSSPIGSFADPSSFSSRVTSPVSSPLRTPQKSQWQNLADNYDPNSYKGNDLSGLSDEDTSIAKSLIDKGKDVTNYLQAARQDNKIHQQAQHDNSFLGKIANFGKEIPNAIGDIGKTVGSSLEQGAGDIADLAVEGGTAGSLWADQHNPFLNHDQRVNAMRNDTNAGNTLRSVVHNTKDFSGNNLEGVQAADQAGSNIAAGHGNLRDWSTLAGTGLQAGLDATMFADPLQMFGRSVGEQAAKNASKRLLNAALRTGDDSVVKDAVNTIARSNAARVVRPTVEDGIKPLVQHSLQGGALFGGSMGTAAGLQTYGATGDPLEALKQAGIAGATGFALQPAMDIGGYALGRGVGRAASDTAQAGRYGLTKAADATGKAYRALNDAKKTMALKDATNGTKTVSTPLDKLVSHEGAPDRRRVDEYKARIQNGGDIEPLIVMRDSDGRYGVEDGKHRLQALSELGIRNAPVRVATPAGLRRAMEGGYMKNPFGKDDNINPERVPNIPRGKQVNDAFSRSTAREPLGKVGDVNIEIGSFGKNALARKTTKSDRLTKSQIKASLKHVKRVYRASDNPSSYRKDNIALVAEMPNGEKRVIYTRLNKDGNEEVINAHKIKSVPNYEDSLKSFGTPAQNRTGKLRLRTPRGESAPRERGGKSSLDTSETSLHNASTVAKTARNVKPSETLRKLEEAKNDKTRPANHIATKRSGVQVSHTSNRGTKLSANRLKQEVDNRQPDQSARSNPTTQAHKRPARREAPANNESGVVPYNKNTPTDENFNVSEYINNQHKAQQSARKASEQGKASKFTANLKTKLIDDLSPIEDTLNKSLKKTGTKLSPDQHISQQLDRAIRADTIAGQYMKDNGLDKIIQTVKSPKEFDQYLIARHAADMERKGINTGRNKSADRQLLKKLAPEYEGQAKAITKYTQGMLDTAADYGLISRDLATALKKEYPNYVPLNRVFSEEERAARYNGPSAGHASKSTQKVVQRIKGSGREIESPLGSIIQKSQDLIKEGEQNKAAKILASYEKLPGNPFELRKLKPGETVDVKPVISYLEDGKVHRYETTPAVAAAAKALNRQQANILIKILRVPTRILRLGATSINSGFALANLTKDMASAAINSKHPLRSTLDLRVVGKALDTAFHHRGKNYDEFIREGAGGTQWDIARDAPHRNLKMIRADKGIGSKALYTVTRPAQLLRAVEDTIGRTEELTRAMQYYGNKKAALREGLTDNQARVMGADAARSNTVNFARHGEYGEVLNSVLPYLNAGIQGSRTFLRNVKARPGRTLGKVALLSTLPAVTTTTWNISDPQRRKAYEDISEYEKEGNIIIVPPNPKKDPKTGKWNVIKIPVSQEVANLNNIARNAVESAAGTKGFSIKDTLANLIGTATSLNVQTPRQAVGQVIPQALKPGIETLTNQNLFTGNQIVPDSQKNLPAGDQYGKYTSITAKTLGKALGISPRVIDNNWRTATGGAGQTVLNASDNILHSFGAKGNIQGTDLATSISHRFYGANAKPASDVIEDRFDKLKQQVINSDAYKNASQYDKSRMLNRLQNDISAVEYNKAGYGDGKLSSKQKALQDNGFKLSTYTDLDAKSGGISISPSLNESSTKILDHYNSMDSSARKNWFNTQNDAEYKYYKAKYENDKANGDISSVQDITRKKQLQKDKVGSVYPKMIRDLHSLSKANLREWFAKPEKGIDKKKIYKQLVAYDQALYNKGLESYLKLKYGLGSGRGRGGGSSKKYNPALIDLKFRLAQSKPTMVNTHAPNLKAIRFTPGGTAGPVVKLQHGDTGVIHHTKITRKKSKNGVK